MTTNTLRAVAVKIAKTYDLILIMQCWHFMSDLTNNMCYIIIQFDIMVHFKQSISLKQIHVYLKYFSKSAVIS